MIKVAFMTLSLLMVQTSYAEDILGFLEAKKTESIVQEKSQLTKSMRRALGRTTAEQNIFLNFLDKMQYDKALFQWSAAFEDTKFSRSANGRALHAYVLFKNNLQVNAVEHLFSVKKVTGISRELLRLFRVEIPSNHNVWKYAQIKWSPAWTRVFDVATEVKVLSRQEFNPKNKKQIYSLLKKTKVGTEERSWLEWQMALSLALNAKVSESAKVLAHLLTQENKVMSNDLINLTAARLLFEQGYLDAAARYYQKIPKKSEYWFVSQEELAWTYIRKGEPQNTLAVTKSLMIPEFMVHVGPELVFLDSLASLKVCDYPQVAVSVQNFRKRFKQRAKALIELENSGSTPSTEYLITRLKQGPVTLNSLGAHAEKLPLYVSRDAVLRDLVGTQKHLEQEAEVAGELYARSLAGGSAKVGFQAVMEDMKTQFARRAQSAKNASLNLIKRRARSEIAQIKNMLQKMHIVEAELIQQISIAERVIKSTKKMAKKDTMTGTTKKANKYDLKFPFVGETWFDELSNYKIDLKKGCQAKSR